jgi:hypothetical protein
MLPLQSILQERKILIISTHLHDIGYDLGGFYGSFLLNMFSREMGLQGRIPLEQRIPLLFIADECHTFSGYNWTNHMSQLTKFGFWNVLGAQTFATLRESAGETGNNLPEILLGGVQSLAVFQVNGADAEYLAQKELSSDIGGPKHDTLINLDTFQFWFKTLGPKGNRLQPFDAELLRPLPVDVSQQQAVFENRSQYSVLIEDAKRDSERVLNDFLMKYGGPSMLSAGATGLPPDEMVERTAAGDRKPRKRTPDDTDSEAARALSGEAEKGDAATVLPSWNQLPSQQKPLSDTETEEFLSGLIDVANTEDPKDPESGN